MSSWAEPPRHMTGALAAMDTAPPAEPRGAAAASGARPGPAPVGGWDERKAVRVRAKLKARGAEWQRKARWALEALAAAGTAGRTVVTGDRVDNAAITAAAAANVGGAAAARLGARVFDPLGRQEEWEAAACALGALAQHADELLADVAGGAPQPTAGIRLFLRQLQDPLAPASARRLAADALGLTTAANAASCTTYTPCATGGYEAESGGSNPQNLKPPQKQGAEVVFVISVACLHARPTGASGVFKPWLTGPKAGSE